MSSISKRWYAGRVLGALVACFTCSSSAFGDEKPGQTWDLRLNGVWKVTSVLQDGVAVEDDSDCEYAILDGMVVSASAGRGTFMPDLANESVTGRAETPDKTDGSDSDPLFPPQVSPNSSAPRAPKEFVVNLTVSRASVRRMEPYSWIDLQPQWEKGDVRPGIYHIEGNKLTLAFGAARPTDLHSPKVVTDGFTPPAPVSIVMTLIRKRGTGSVDLDKSQKRTQSEE